MANSPKQTAPSGQAETQAKGKKEIWVTIVCAFLVAGTSVVAALLARQTISKYEIREVSALAATTSTDYFPLKVGNYWKYTGTTRCAKEDGTVGESQVHVTMSVIDAVTDKENPGVALFIMQGHPSDAVDFGGSKTAPEPKDLPGSRYGYLVISNKVFHVEPDGLEATRKAIEEGGFLEETLLRKIELVLELPLFRGQRFGELNQLARKDFLYCWNVTEATTWHSRAGQKVTALPEYELVYATLPDGVTVRFLPYLGFTDYQYGHHGTISEVELHLVEYKVHTE